jgi:hypothetical protein
MARENEEDGNEGGSADDDFLSGIAAKYEKADKKAGVNQSEDEDEDAEQPDPDEEDSEEEGSAEEDDDSDAEHPDADTEEDSDEESDATDADSDEDDDTDTDDPASDEDDEDAESDDDADADDDDPDAEEDEDDDETVSAGSRAALEENGADLKLDDIKDKSVRALVEKKFKSVDAAFTRSVQKKHRELSERFGTEERYRRENPDLFIAELIVKDPAILDRVNAGLFRCLFRAEAVRVQARRAR